MLATTKLEELGLTKSEIKVYLYLLEHGEQDPNDIANHTGIQRTNCYNILKQLLKRDLIQKHKNKRPITYSPNSPASLLQDIEYRKDIAQLLLPELNNLFKSSDNKPSIRIYEGESEVKEIYQQIIGCGDVLGLAATDNLDELYPDFITSEWPAQLKKNGQHLRDILTKNGSGAATRKLEEGLGENYEYVFLPESMGNIWTDLLIWDDNIALINVTTPVFGTVIRNKQITDMMRMMFEFMWKALDVKK